MHHKAAHTDNFPFDYQIAAIAATIRKSPSAAYRISTLASSIGMSRSQFARAFRNSVGHSPIDFLRRARLDFAAHLLQTTSQPVKTVSLAAGYESRSTFTHAFRKCFGKSPAEFRRPNADANDLTILSVSASLRMHSAGSQELAWEVDISRGTVWWSDATCQALAHDPAKRMVADVSRFYERIHPEDRTAVLHSMQAACAESRMSWEAEFRFLATDDKTYVDILNACLILRNRSGAPTRLIGAMQLRQKPGRRTADDSPAIVGNALWGLNHSRQLR